MTWSNEIVPRASLNKVHRVTFTIIPNDYTSGDKTTVVIDIADSEVQENGLLSSIQAHFHSDILLSDSPDYSNYIAYAGEVQEITIVGFSVDES